MMLTLTLTVRKHPRRAVGPGRPGASWGARVLGRRAVVACSRPSWEAGLGGGADIQEAAGSAAGPQEIQLLPGGPRPSSRMSQEWRL